MTVGQPPVRSTEETVDDLMEIRQFIERFRTRAPASSDPFVHEVQETLDRVITDVRNLSYGYVHRQPAHAADADLMIHAPVLDTSCDSPRYRSPWYWFTLPDGDLIMGAYPQDDFYDEICARIALRSEIAAAKVL